MTIGLIAFAVNEEIQDATEVTEHTVSMLKILETFSQQVLIINQFEFNWPNLMESFSFFNDFVVAAPLEAFSLDCYYKEIFSRTALVRVFVSTLMPLFLNFMTIFVFYIYHIIKHGTRVMRDKELQSKV